MPPVFKFVVFTIHVSEERSWDPFSISWDNSNLRYITCQLEKGEETSALHWQGYAEIIRGTGLKSWKEKYLKCAWAHIEQRLGSQEQAIAYTRKSETFVGGEKSRFEFGVPTRTNDGSERKRVSSNNTPYSKALKSGRMEDALAILEEDAPRDYVIYHAGIRRSLLTIFESRCTEPAKAAYSKESFTLPQLDIQSLGKTIVLCGTSGIGKTQFALSHFEKPLLVSHIDDLKKYSPTTNDGIVFDDMNFSHWPASACIHITDMDHARSINVKYGTATIPKGCGRIFTSNREFRDIFAKEASEAEWKAIERRCYVLELTENLFH